MVSGIKYFLNEKLFKPSDRYFESYRKGKCELSPHYRRLFGDDQVSERLGPKSFQSVSWEAASRRTYSYPTAATHLIDLPAK